MNREIKPVVYEILSKDKNAREDTMDLIKKTVIQMLDCSLGTPFGIVLEGMKYKGISFEAIARHKRSYLTENPESISEEAEQIRRQEEQKYEWEYSRHIPRID